MRRGGRTPIPTEDRFWAFVKERPEGGCWLWGGRRTYNGYGVFSDNRTRTKVAHKWAYEWAVGAVPAGLQIDHLCAVRACVNPAHLEAVTPLENSRRAQARRVPSTHCKRGHAYDEENTYHYDGRRYCRACNRVRGRSYREAA